MKQNYLKTLLVCLFAFTGMTAFAQYYGYYNCEVDGIRYILNNNDNTATVVAKMEPNGWGGESNIYSGAINIPATVEDNGETYTVTSIDGYAFYYSLVEELTIPSTILYITPFTYCGNLKKIEVDEDNPVYDSRGGCNAVIRKADNVLIAGCNSTQIPDGVTAIEIAAFEGCWGLREVIIPNSVTSIGLAAFDECTSLKTVVIGNSVQTIGTGAFRMCYALTSVTSLNPTPPTLDLSAYPPFGNDATLYVPYGSASAYQNTEWGNEFTNIVEIAPETLTVSVGTDGLATYCPVFGVDFSNATNIAAYKAAVEGNMVMLTKVETVAAGEGVLLRSLKEGEAVEEKLPVVEDATKNEGNAFVGLLHDYTLSEKVDNYTNFVLSKKGGVIGFYKANDTRIAAGKAYLRVENYSPSADAKGLSLMFDDGTTIINEVKGKPSIADDAAYALDGVRVENPAKGIYIKNGKKVVIK